jgi:hypothetical protein
VAGTLDTISASRSDILLRLPDGTTVPVRLLQHDPEGLRALFAGRVVVSGMARFRTSGKLLRVDAEHIGLARESDALWEKQPAPRPSRSDPVARHVPQDEKTGVSAFLGTWPGDESDEELLAALKAIR